MLVARVEEVLLGGSVDVLDAFACTMMRHSDDLIVFVLLRFVKADVDVIDIFGVILIDIVVLVAQRRAPVARGVPLALTFDARDVGLR